MAVPIRHVVACLLSSGIAGESSVVAQQSALDSAMARYTATFEASTDSTPLTLSRVAVEWSRVSAQFGRARHHRWQAVSLLNGANVQRALKNDAARLQVLDTLLALLRMMGDTALEGDVRFDMGAIYRGRRREDLARLYANPDGSFQRGFGPPPLPIPTRPRSPADSADLLESRLPFDLTESNVAERVTQLDRVQALYGEAKNHWEQGRTLRRIAACHAFVGGRDSARIYLARANDLARAAQDRIGLVAGLLAHGQTLEEEGDPAGAQQRYELALRVAGDHDAVGVIFQSVARSRLSGLAGAGGDHDRALSLANRALAVLIDTAQIVGPDAKTIDVAAGMQVMLKASQSAVSPYDVWRDVRGATVHALQVAARSYRAYGRTERAQAYEEAARAMMPRGAERRAAAGC